MFKLRALVIHEMRTLRWFLLAGILCALMFVWLVSGNQEDMFSSWFITVLQVAHKAAIVAFGIMVTLQFADLHQKRKQEFMASLPYTQRKRILVKVLLGYGVITISCLVLTILVLLVRGSQMSALYERVLVSPGYKEILANETVCHTLRSLAIFWVTLLALYSLYVAVHVLVSHGIVATLLGIGVLLVSVWFHGVIMVLNNGLFLEGERPIHMNQSVFRILETFFGESVRGEIEAGYWFGIYYDNMWLVLLFVGAILVISFMVIFLMSGKKDLARDSMLIPNKVARTLFATGMAIGFGTTVVLGASQIVITIIPQEIRLFLVGTITLIICVVLWIVCRKILKSAVK